MMQVRLKDVQIDPHTALLARGLGDFGKVQKFIDSEVIRLMMPYVPFEVGTLQNSLYMTVVGSGLVQQSTPYAKYLYYNPQFNFNGAPKRGGMWFERMKNDNKTSILQGAATLAGGRVG